MELLKWDVYELWGKNSPVTGVKMRGRLRKFAIEQNINFLADNTEDIKGHVRFAVLHGTDISPIKKFLKTILPDYIVELKETALVNPVLSKLKVNITSRYKI